MSEQLQKVIDELHSEIDIDIYDDVVYDIYAIDKLNYDLLYASGFKNGTSCDFVEASYLGKKCYEFIHGVNEPCEFCALKNSDKTDRLKEHRYEYNGHTFATRFRETQWNGRPAYVKYVRDITEYIVSRKEKDRLEEYFRTVVQHLPGGMAVVHHSKDGTMTPEYLSDGFSEMVGMSKDESWALYEGNALSGVHPDDREYVRENMNRCIREKHEKYEMQYRLMHKNGHYIWIKARFSVIYADDGGVRVYADFHDISAEKHMQEQLSQQYQEQINQHYKMAGSDALVLGHCNITQNQVCELIDYTGAGFVEKLGITREDLIKGLGEFITDKEEKEKFLSIFLNDPMLRAYGNGVEERKMTCFMEFPGHKAGKYVQVKVIIVEVPGTDDITGILAINDITEKIIREKVFMQLSESNYDLVANVDLLANRYEIVSGGDEYIPDKTGFHSERLRRVIDETVIESEKETVYVKHMLDPNEMMSRLSKEGSYSFTYSIHDKKGDLRTKKMIVSAVDLRLGRVCFIRADVTDVLKAEIAAKEKLEKALKEAENASRVKSEFLSSMSHDIRTPMNAIVGMTTLALANIDNKEKIKDYLQKISVSSQHLLSLINDILDMSQIEKSKIYLNRQSLKIDEIISHVANIMTSQAENGGIKFIIENKVTEQGGFYGDSLRMNQILLNLLSNAFKFTAEGGDVIFRIEPMQPKDEEHVKYLFTVADTGIGMSEEFMKTLFEPFNRSLTVAKVEGTGLGLSITKALVELMGGEIHVTSKLNFGTTFEIELEFEKDKDCDDECDGKECCAQEIENLAGYNFLMVEDNEINSEILGELLQMRGATFTLKENGLEALEEFKNCIPGTYDAIFMDIQMPVMNGYEATREIRKLNRPDAKSIIILAMTANAFASDVKASMEAGMDGHIAKPVDMKLLYNTISALLKKRKQ